MKNKEKYVKRANRLLHLEMIVFVYIMVAALVTVIAGIGRNYNEGFLMYILTLPFEPFYLFFGDGNLDGFLGGVRVFSYALVPIISCTIVSLRLIPVASRKYIIPVVSNALFILFLITMSDSIKNSGAQIDLVYIVATAVLAFLIMMFIFPPEGFSDKDFVEKKHSKSGKK